jgi:hypothetical protein
MLGASSNSRCRALLRENGPALGRLPFSYGFISSFSPSQSRQFSPLVQALVKASKELGISNLRTEDWQVRNWESGIGNLGTALATASTDR